MRSLSKPVASGPPAIGTMHPDAQTGPLAPPIMAKNRYSREELLALRPPEGTSLDPAIYDRAPSYASEEQLPPICLLPFSESEEVLDAQCFSFFIREMRN